MNIDNQIDQLRKIRPVEAPVFLFTRIKQRIETLAGIPAPLSWKFGFAATSLVILALNIGILFKSSTQPKEQGLEQVMNSMQLNTSNELYHE